MRWPASPFSGAPEAFSTDTSGAPENGEAGQRIVRFLVDELK